MAELGKGRGSAAKGDLAMGMKGYVGDLARTFGVGGHGTGVKGETVPPAPALHSSFLKKENRNPGWFSNAWERKSNPSR